MKKYSLIKRIVLSYFIIFSFNINYAQNRGITGKRTGSDFKIVAQIGQVIDGYTIKDFKLGFQHPLINELGQIFFNATTDKGFTMFRDNSAVASHEMKIDGEEATGFEDFAIGKNGGYCFMTFLVENSNRKAALIINGHIALKFGERLSNGFRTDMMNPLTAAKLFFNSDGRCILINTMGNVIIDGRDYIARKDIKKEDDLIEWNKEWKMFGNVGDNSTVLENNGLWLLYNQKPSNSFLMSKDQKFFPVFEPSKAICLNARGHILTSDLLCFDYSDATSIKSTEEKNEVFLSREKFEIEFPYKRLLGLEPLGLKNGRPFYDIISEPLLPDEFAFNDNDKFALLQHYALSHEENGGIKDSWAIIAGTANFNIISNDGLNPSPGDLIAYFDKGSQFCKHVGVVKIVEGKKVLRIRSKWAGGAVFDSKPDSCGYGANWFIFRRNNIRAKLWGEIRKTSGEFEDKLNFLPKVATNCDGNIIPITTDQAKAIAGSPAPLEHHYLTDIDGKKISSSASLVEEYIPTRPRQSPYSSYDCRGFAFGWRQLNIPDTPTRCDGDPNTNHTLRIILDGYIPVAGYNEKGVRHYWDPTKDSVPPPL